MSSSTCDIPQEIVDEFRKFKLGNKHTSGIIYKVNKDKLLVEVEHVLENTPFDDIKEYLPESAPRFIAYSYKHTHSDGRSSMPLVLVFFCPPDINTTLAMLYSSTKTKLINALQVMKTFDIQDPELLGEKWLKEKLKFFD